MYIFVDVILSEISKTPFVNYLNATYKVIISPIS